MKRTILILIASTFISCECQKQKSVIESIQIPEEKIVKEKVEVKRNVYEAFYTHKGKENKVEFDVYYDNSVHKNGYIIIRNFIIDGKIYTVDLSTKDYITYINNDKSKFKINIKDNLNNKVIEDDFRTAEAIVLAFLEYNGKKQLTEDQVFKAGQRMIGRKTGICLPKHFSEYIK